MKRIIIFITVFICSPTVFGQLWQSVNANYLNPQQIRVIYGDSVKDELIVGYNNNSYTSPFNHLAIYRNGNWDSMSCGTWGNPLAICRYKEDIIIGGAFQILGNGDTVNHIVSWDGVSYTKLLKGVYGPVYDLLVHNDTLYVFGAFDSVDGTLASKIACWDGTSWSAFDTTKWYVNGIYSGVFYNGELYIAGNFRKYDNSIINIAKWNGNTWVDIGNGQMHSSGSWWINDLAVYNNELYAGGYFTMNSGAPGNYIAKWDSTNWSNVGSGFDDGQVWSLHVFNSELYIGGAFNHFNGIQSNIIAKWDGSKLCSFAGNITGGGINTMTALNNELYIGGLFLGINNDTTMSFITKWIGGNHVDSCYPQISNIFEFDKENSISFYPNPIRDIIEINLEEVDQELQIYDIQGKLVMSEKLEYSPGSTKMKVDLSRLLPGIYLLKIINTKQVKQAKIVKI